MWLCGFDVTTGKTRGMNVADIEILRSKILSFHAVPGRTNAKEALSRTAACPSGGDSRRSYLQL